MFKIPKFIFSVLVLVGCCFAVVPLKHTLAETVTSRIEGSTRYETAVEISKLNFPNGAETVVLVTGEDFPDALAGSPLAYSLHAPILTTYHHTLPPQVLNEIQRLGATNIVILGGNVAINETVENELKNLSFSVERISGNNRYETSALIAQRLPSDMSIVASGSNFPDALAVAPYAASQGIPILLTDSKVLSSEIKAQLRSKSLIIGGEVAVNSSVSSKISNNTRISGENRYETNLRIIDYFDNSFEKAYLATGTNFADALTGSILAAASSDPIVLVKPDFLPVSTELFLKNRGITNLTILGGIVAVSDKVSTAVKSLDTKTYFTPLKTIEFYDYGSYTETAGTIQPGVILSSTGLKENQYLAFSYGNSLGLVDKNLVKTSFTNEEIYHAEDLYQSTNSNKTILLDKQNVKIYDKSNYNREIATLYSGQRLPVISENSMYYSVNIGGKDGVISKKEVSQDNGIPILMYHHILRDQENEYYRNVSTTISDVEFQAQMALLNRYGYKTITLPELELYLDKKKNLPAKTVVITFDDGLKSVYKYGFPVLKKYNFTASEFMITNRIPDWPKQFNPDDLQFLSWDEMKAMQDVFEYHSHTHALHQLTIDRKGYLITMSDEVIMADLLKSKSLLNNTPYFAYPFGHYNSNTISILKKLQFRMAFTTIHGKVKVGDDKYQLKRIGVPPGISLNEFISEIKN